MGSNSKREIMFEPQIAQLQRAQAKNPRSQRRTIELRIGYTDGEEQFRRLRLRSLKLRFVLAQFKRCAHQERIDPADSNTAHG